MPEPEANRQTEDQRGEDFDDHGVFLAVEDQVRISPINPVMTMASPIR